MLEYSMQGNTSCYRISQNLHSKVESRSRIILIGYSSRTESHRLPSLFQGNAQKLGKTRDTSQKLGASCDHQLPPITASATELHQQGSYLQLHLESISVKADTGRRKADEGQVKSVVRDAPFFEKKLQEINEEWRNVDRQYQRSGDKFDFLLSNIIGSDAVFVGPFGLRRRRSLRCIEDFIESRVLPSYGNTHSSGSQVALQTNAFREEARRVIKKCVNAGPDDALIFTGSGATGAVQTLVGVLELQERRRRGERVSVVHGPLEHHSNILPWRESADVCVRAPLAESGGVDMAALEATLRKMRAEADGASQLLIGAFSAASNVTGVITDTDAVTALLHAHGAIAVWDFACAGPHMVVDMNSGADTAFDALLLSPHKFLGGPGTPGVLVAKRRLFQNRVPYRPGGGTVEFVIKDAHQYESDIEIREEGGTPAIVDCIRCGLVFRVKREIGDAEIHDREAELLRWAWQVLPSMENVLVLGHRSAPRLPVFSFLIVNRETGLFLHHNFVAILLSDLYGVQSRAGCACAGPYATDLLSFDEETLRRFPSLGDGNNRLRNCIENYPKIKAQARNDPSSCRGKDLEILKPGFVRINLPCYYTNEMIAFVFEAIDMVSRHGWKLLPEYQCDPYTGSWVHKGFRRQLHGLNEFSIDLARAQPDCYSTEGKADDCPSFTRVAASARKILMLAETRFRRQNAASPPATVDTAADWEGLADSQRQMRWFALPHEAASCMKNVSVV